VTDATSAIIAVVLLFCLPKKNIFKGHSYQHLVDWNLLQKVFPWQIFLLIGGGLVMATGFQVEFFSNRIPWKYISITKKRSLKKESGLSDWSGQQLKNLSGGNKQIALVFIVVLAATAPEFTSNVSIASIFIPIVDALVRGGFKT
jgi:sodium-dependent dicarboxylate transporter 2/3/5